MEIPTDMRKKIPFMQLTFAFFIASTLQAQHPKKPTSSEIYHNLQKLNFLGTALYVGAHPDDENTALISYLVNEVHANAAYLSVTRGDGGQNLIGPELRELLGVIRTEELLGARNIDGGFQFFTRANDFGFSKNPDETFDFWEREQVLSDVVSVIRRFKPDIIINRFDYRTPGTTHGHHTASAMLSMDAFDIVGQASFFPESAQRFGTWNPKRLFFNTSRFLFTGEEDFDKIDTTKTITFDIGSYYPELGLSNGEIAALSRTSHKSQGFGMSGSRGRSFETLEILKGGLPATNNPFEGIETGWKRIAGGDNIGAVLNPLERQFDFENPAAILPELLKAYPLIEAIKDEYWRELKLAQLRQLILDCGGIFLEAVSDRNSVNPAGEFELIAEAINRGGTKISLQRIINSAGEILWEEGVELSPNLDKRYRLKTHASRHNPEYTTPYWLNAPGTVGMYQAEEEFIGLPKAPAPETVTFELQFGNQVIPFYKSVIYKFNDRVKGEVYRPLEILPEATVSINEKVIIFADGTPKTVPVTVRAGKDRLAGNVSLNSPAGWKISPQNQPFDLKRKGETAVFNFTVTPPSQQHEGVLEAVVRAEGKTFTHELNEIKYDHIPNQAVLLPAKSKIARLDIRKKGEKIGYIDGAGDVVAQSLEQIGYEVSTIPPKEISFEKLRDFDAVVVGIRAYNTVPELIFAQPALNKFVENGGTLIVQYNTNTGLLTEELAPYPLKISRDRVTDEFSDVEFLAPNHPILNMPNKITQKDFEGWVQERGLYFPSEWDAAFTPVLGMHDKGEAQTQGSLLAAQFGKGYFVYTGLSFFRELPAGVSGAYRLFANMVSLGR